MIKTTAQPWDNQLFRLIGVLPIIIFIARLIQYIQVGTPDWILASCHISNLMLGAGMIFGTPLLVRVATIWLVIGVPIMVYQLLGVLAPLSTRSNRNGLRHRVWASDPLSNVSGESSIKRCPAPSG